MGFYWLRFAVVNNVLMNCRSKCLSGLVFPPIKDGFNFRDKKNHVGQGLGNTGGGESQNSYFLFLQKRRNYCGCILTSRKNASSTNKREYLLD